MNLMKLFTTYDGRISRSQYWIGFLVFVVVAFVVGLALGAMGSGGNGEPGILEILLNIALIPLVFAVYIKRFHDLGKSGWFSLLLIVPLVNILVGIFWLGFVKGTDGPNEYGEDPVAQK